LAGEQKGRSDTRLVKTGSQQVPRNFSGKLILFLTKVQILTPKIISFVPILTKEHDETHSRSPNLDNKATQCDNSTLIS
jgi:hypothetical protein